MKDHDGMKSLGTDELDEFIKSMKAKGMKVAFAPGLWHRGTCLECGYARCVTMDISIAETDPEFKEDCRSCGGSGIKWTPMSVSDGKTPVTRSDEVTRLFMDENLDD